ncbi:low-density lipoprotein receptor class A domain-containing protein 3-like isoform X1 [Hermetia illucens]|uniref:low-density lipoprotein receptor class A domain-containing protein 3-like isoform X1 n=1 Tax=Hermetia illucens TaxID=343691 RepID=UPI0018CC4EE8|nr:low-density lipoprotein receptor class A domain-containing protein 3-like isoform X1 [Hermetia illucens]
MASKIFLFSICLYLVLALVASGKSTMNSFNSHEECSLSEFQCDSGECIPGTKVCDGHPNCPEGEDEDDCEPIRIKA